MLPSLSPLITFSNTFSALLIVGRIAKPAGVSINFSQRLPANRASLAKNLRQPHYQ
jgi:hypothetical protein